MTRRPLLHLWFLAFVALLAVLAAPGAAAAAPGDDGWVRLAHLSPDTPAVDVQVTADGGSDPVVSLADVAYGDVSDYIRLPAGSYTASMRPAGGDPSSAPVFSVPFTVAGGVACTAAAVGTNADLTATVVQDDLTVPAAGQARIRLLQASVAHASVTVTAVDGPVLAADAAFPTATGYAEIPAGSWSLAVTAGGRQVGSATGVQVEPGSVNTLVVLDGADGATTVTALQDAVGSGVTPSGGVETGAGGTAEPGSRPPAAAVLAGGCIVAGCAVLGGTVGLRVDRRRRA